MKRAVKLHREVYYREDLADCSGVAIALLTAMTAHAHTLDIANEPRRFRVELTLDLDG